VIADSTMAPMTGMELLQRVRADERTKQTPFVMVANDSSEGSEAERRTASGYILKPFNAQSLKTKLVPVFGAF